MGAVNSYDPKRMLLYELFADVDKQLNILRRWRLPVTLAGQLDIMIYLHSFLSMMALQTMFFFKHGSDRS